MQPKLQDHRHETSASLHGAPVYCPAYAAVADYTAC